MIQALCVRFAVAWSVATLLVACASSPYGPNGANGGFNEQKLAENVFWVGYYGNGHTPKEQVVSYWLHRCAELTVQNGYSYFSLVPDGSSRKSGAEDPRVPTVGRDVGELRLIPVNSKGGGVVVVPIYGTGISRTWYKVGTIAMYHTRVSVTTPEHTVALHARTVMARLGDYVRSGGSIPPPSSKEVIDAAVLYEPFSPSPEPAPERPARAGKPI